MTFSENLKRCKDERGYTIEELSRRSGVPVGTLSKLLSGVIAEPKMAVVLALAKGLSVSLSHLLDPAGEYISETLDEEEREVLASYRRLDTHSRELVRMVMEKQLSFVASSVSVPAASVGASAAADTEEKATGAKILSFAQKQKARPKGGVPLFDLPVSAGTGEFLDSDRASRTVTLPESMKEKQVSFALLVNGDSMEPRFKNGDLLFVSACEGVEREELGIFLLDGEGYFKQYMGDHLHSLNPAYGDIPLGEYTDVRCVGRVVGHLARKAKS